MEKLFFFDIDGTLIECEKGVFSIQVSTRNSLDLLKENGHSVFLATGRCKCFIVDGVMDYPFSGFVTCNGAYVEYKDRCVYKKVIPYEAIKKTHQLCVEKGLAYYFESNDCIYILNKTNPSHIRFKEDWGMKDEIVVDHFDMKNVETYIGMIVLNSKDEIPVMVETLGPYFDIQRHQSGFSFDLTLKGESKAKGIQQLVKVLKKDMKDTIAFGDGRNDIEMLESVGLGIAMGNGAIEAKSVADYITDDADKNGIENALEHFSFLNK